MSDPPTLRVTCETGPAAGRAVVVGVGRHVIGRHRRAAINVLDPDVEVHHAVVELGADGSVGLTQLAGRVPCRTDGDLVWLGASRLRFGDRPAARDLATALAAIEQGGGRGTGRLRAALGWGRPAELAAAERADEPVEVDVADGCSMTLVGANAAALARAVVVQLAAWSPPDAWELVVLADDTDAWAWCAELPHTTRLDHRRRHGHGDQAACLTLVVTDRASAFAASSGPLPRALAGRSLAVIVVDPAARAPVVTPEVLEINTVGRARWRRASGETVEVQPAGLDVRAAARCARLLARAHAGSARSTASALPPPPLPSRASLPEVVDQHGPRAIEDAVAIHATRVGDDGLALIGSLRHAAALGAGVDLPTCPDAR